MIAETIDEKAYLYVDGAKRKRRSSTEARRRYYASQRARRFARRMESSFALTAPSYWKDCDNRSQVVEKR